jgi:hypothetical protein
MARLPVDMEINAVVTQIQIDHAAEQRLTQQYQRALQAGAVMPGTTRDQYAQASRGSQAGGIMPMVAKSLGMETLFTTLIPAISALTGIIVMAVSNSKIVATVMNTVGKALGLLVDLILMPFLPIIMYVLIKLFGAIIAFGKIWKDIWGSDIVKNFVAGVLALDETIRKLILGGIGFIVDLALKTAGIIWDVLVWLWNSLKAGAGVAVDLAFGIIAGAGKLIYDFLSWLWDGGKAIAKAAFEINFAFFGAIAESVFNVLQYLYKWFKFGASWGKFNLDFILGTGADLVKWLMQNFDRVVNFLNPTIEKVLPAGSTLQMQGTAYGGPGYTDTSNTILGGGVLSGSPRPQLQGGGGNVILNVTGTLFKNEEDLYQKIADKLRRDQWRQNV